MTSSDQPELDVQFDHRLGTLNLDVQFVLQQPWTVLFGPSGSGKTTVLRAIAGFVRPAAGRIVAFGGTKVLFDSTAKTFVQPYLRPVRTAAQGARLFPHMTVRKNVVLGTQWYSKPGDANDLVDEVLGLFELQPMQDRMPGDLSGGEAQKAAIARAVASAVTGSDRTILLLDEPFSGLDLRVRDELLVRLRDWLAVWKIPVLSVTHDVAEAFQLGAEVIKIADGKVVAQGSVEVVLADERKRLLAQLSEPTSQNQNVGHTQNPLREPHLRD